MNPGVRNQDSSEACGIVSGKGGEWGFWNVGNNSVSWPGAGYIGVFILWIFTKLSYFFRYFHYYCTLHWISWTNLYKWVMCFHKFLLMALHQMYWYQNIKFSSRKEGWESQGLTPLFQMSSISLVLQKATLGCRSWREWNMTCLRSTIYLEVELA